MRCHLLQINLLMSHDFPRIHGHLDIVSKSLKIQIFKDFYSVFLLGSQRHARDMGCIQRFVVELLMSLGSIWHHWNSPSIDNGLFSLQETICPN